MTTDNPILNSPYDEPLLHYATDDEGTLDYQKIVKGRRIFAPEIQSIPVRQGPQRSMFEINERAEEFGSHLINLLRKEVGLWRKDGYPSVTRVTRELLTFWFLNPDRHAEAKLFFAQREAIETAIWLNEVADRSNAGQYVLNQLRSAQQVSTENLSCNLPRVAFKMATGTGKTVVMAMQILYHFFNRQEYRNDTRFADSFLIVAPGITIKNRLGVLFVNLDRRAEITDYYHARSLIPRGWDNKMGNLNARIVITNYHAFEPRTLQGNKRSPFDGKINAQGEKQQATEDAGQMLRRVLGKIKPGSRLLILNDEAHHCYLPKEAGKAIEGEDTKEENKRAAVWFTGLTEVAKRFKVDTVYDLSATPYYLTGSGYDAYSLFPWVVTDFGLIEAIEAGLVKIPFLPESDTTHELTMPVLRNLYEHVKDELPKKGQKRRKSDARKEGKTPVGEEPPKLPTLVQAALEKFHGHYQRDYEQIRGLFDSPPVFIVVCNNTSVSKEVYKYIAGYEQTLPDDTLRAIPGHFEIFSNYDRKTHKPLKKPPTLLIDSDALENSDQINDDFKKIFSDEIEVFKREYARIHGQGSAENITEAEIMREVVNSVGKKGMLGAHIRCVVSVSMLTEGWDANTVTHIMGLRAFGSQLLCEQVAGRALRRKNYILQAYDKDGQEIPEDNIKRFKPENITWKFPPEYAHIIGVPFRMFKGGTIKPPPPVDKWHILAIPERQEKFEITFPNVVGYRVESRDGPITADFSNLENFEIDGTKFPLETEMATAFSENTEKLTVRSIVEKREQELFFLITRALINQHYSDDNGQPQFYKFNQLLRIVEKWYHTKVVLLNIPDPAFKKLLYFVLPDRICSHISRGIMAASRATDQILPVLNFYNKFGSTTYVNGHTSRPVFETTKSHVNYVVADTDSWEQIAAKTLEELDEVEAYVKNAFLGFAIPYVQDGKDKLYFPDFIARCRVAEDQHINLIIEISGMSQDKAAKKWYVENRWLPAVNAVREKYEYDPWAFIEIAGDIRDIKNQLRDYILTREVAGV
ncbi:MAG TPA: DEAD/DEAH box helicase family protein [Kiritimatiellia bacterium]|nr:DEAD/DEAH box helicase family protein [Kiritimatiellia bacterium]HMO98127.1 DEAD/DEAH box helicase family protein [Kiritimatiellia bacterium]HMP96184.1 DEAD/DEAH box helicase family protein [Kiritimatiellia bacterium]